MRAGTDTGRAADDTAQAQYAWRVLSVTSLGVLLAGTNTSTLDVALPVVARPDSAWARRRYPEGSRKLAKAIARDRRYGRPIARFRTWFQDLVAGGPSQGGG